MKRLHDKSFVFLFSLFLVSEIIVTIVLVYLNDYILVTISGSILSGTIVGGFVTFSQAKLSSSIYEESRVKYEHLNDIKKFLKGKKAEDLVKIKTGKENGHQENVLLLNDVGIHWPKFSSLLGEVCKNESDLRNIHSRIDESINAIQAERNILEGICQEIENTGRNNRLLSDFFPPGYDISSIEVKGFSHIAKSNKELVEVFNGFLMNQINGTSAEFQSKFREHLKEDIKQFERCRLSKNNECSHSLMAVFWKAWAAHIGEITNDPGKYAIFKARYTKISDLTGQPEIFTSTVREAIENVLKTEKIMKTILDLKDKAVRGERDNKAILAELEMEMMVIENSYYLRNDCNLLNQY